MIVEVFLCEARKYLTCVSEQIVILCD